MQETIKLRAGLYYYKGHKVLKVENGWKVWLTEKQDSDIIRPTFTACKGTIDEIEYQRSRWAI